MNKMKWFTIETAYSRNSTALLAYLSSFPIMKTHKVIVTYGDSCFDIPKNNHFGVINISRHGREYKGFANFYHKIWILSPENWQKLTIDK